MCCLGILQRSEDKENIPMVPSEDVVMIASEYQAMTEVRNTFQQLGQL